MCTLFRLTVQEIADQVGISTGSAHSILIEDLHMCRVVVKFVPKLLSQEQQLRLAVARDLLECASGALEFLKTVIALDETWVYRYDPETKVQSSQWKHSSSPRPKKAQQVQSKVKVLLSSLTIAGLCIIVMHQKAKLSTKNAI
jgi:hypothetical protein